MGAERRMAERKEVDAIVVSDITALTSYNVVARTGAIIDASTRGFLLHIQREDLIPPELRSNLSLEDLVGQQLVLFLPQMNLDLDGTVTRAIHKGKGLFQIAVDFSDEVPEYWRECLIDLLPAPGEMEE
ncbi:MAG: hypothetical protein HRT45_01800 [Bdellovibrionales bacterium]|nr:hypothetical protein [Bdellovibrionales bacterium]